MNYEQKPCLIVEDFYASQSFSVSLNIFGIPHACMIDAQLGLDALVDGNFEFAIIGHRLKPFTGTELYIKSRSRGSKVPVLFTGSSIPFEDQKRLFAQGDIKQYHFLPKPFMHQELDLHIGLILGYGVPYTKRHDLQPIH